MVFRYHVDKRYTDEGVLLECTCGWGDWVAYDGNKDVREAINDHLQRHNSIGRIKGRWF